jgi:hypothetical protein
MPARLRLASFVLKCNLGARKNDPQKIPLIPSEKFSMPEKNKAPRRPILTRKEQTLLAFILALLVVGGIVRKLRIDWRATSSVPAHKS